MQSKRYMASLRPLLCEFQYGDSRPAVHPAGIPSTAAGSFPQALSASSACLSSRLPPRPSASAGTGVRASPVFAVPTAATTISGSSRLCSRDQCTGSSRCPSCSPRNLPPLASQSAAARGSRKRSTAELIRGRRNRPSRAAYMVSSRAQSSGKWVRNSLCSELVPR
jgi:hypothetical protein